MASAITKPEKRLGEFLKEQQEPFFLDVYLLEKGYSKKCTSSKRKPLFPFLKALTVLHKKLAFHNQSNSNKHTNIGVPHEDQTIVETDRFSTASSSTMFNSCSDIDEEEVTNNGKHHQRCIKVSMADETLNKDVSVWGIEQRIQSCGGVVVLKKITEDSLLSAALWSSLINQTAKRKHRTKKVLQMEKAKQLLFDCVKEMTINRPRKDERQQGCKQFTGPEKLWKKTKEWSQRATGNETNQTNLMNFDYLDSINEWSEFKPQVREIGVEIADAILERLNNEIVCELIQILPPNIVTNSY